MQRLFLFLYQYRAFFLFVFFEVFSVWLIVNNNQYQGTAFFNSANTVAGNVLQTKHDINSYFDLKEVNQTLAEENASLRKTLSRSEQLVIDSVRSPSFGAALTEQFEFRSARVINNSTRGFSNYITINKGSEDGIMPDMAVINSEGVVGKVKVTSKKFSTVVSLLHPDLFVSSIIKGTRTLCTTKWDGRNSNEAQLLYVPRHLKVAVGDTVITSGYNAIFPQGIMIGIIEDVDIKEDATFYDITVNLATNFDGLSFVYVVKNNLKEEIDSLQQQTYSTNE